MRKIKLGPNDKKQMEFVLLNSIRECNRGIKRCNAEGNKKRRGLYTRSKAQTVD